MTIINKPAFASTFVVLLAGALSAHPSEAAYLKGGKAKNGSENDVIAYGEASGNLTRFRLLDESDDNDPPVRFFLVMLTCYYRRSCY